MTKDDGGPAFPTKDHPHIHADYCHGMTLRDYFAAHAPAPTGTEVGREREKDRARNPHNDYGKPKLRSDDEIIAALAYRYADAMLAARKDDRDGR